MRRAYGDPTPTQLDVPAGGNEEMAFDVSSSGRWYDVLVTVDGDPEFSRLFAGRIENGEHSTSDPAMGVL